MDFSRPTTSLLWQVGLNEPMWVMTNLQAEEGLAIYLQRMKIEESFRDLKSLLGIEKKIFNNRTTMESMVALMMITYSIILILGETLRQNLFPETSRKYKAYSGPIILIKFKLNLPRSKWKAVLDQANIAYQTIISPVRSHF